jgi:hypothetical protein
VWVANRYFLSVLNSPATRVNPHLSPRNELNVRYVWLTGLAPDFPVWAKALPDGQFLQALILPCIAGRSPFVPRPCWEGTSDFPETTWLREELRQGRIKALGEMAPQLFGISPADSRLEPDWVLAEEFDVPVAIHMGSGPPNAAYEARYKFRHPNDAITSWGRTLTSI